MIEASKPMLGLLADVRAFHEAHGTTDATEPLTHPPEALVKLRAKLILEEVIETFGAAFKVTMSPEEFKAATAQDVAALDHEEVDMDLEAFADGLADVIYVCVGAALALGLQDRFARVWTEVQRSNMAKTGGPRRADGKILKPEGWTPPRIGEALSAP